MPWSEKQNRLFRAIEHGWRPPASSGIHIKRRDATRMANEGVKRARGGLALAGGGLLPGAGGGFEDDQNIPGDPKLDPRSRALAEMNKRYQQQASFQSAQAATRDITGRMRGGRHLGLPHLADPWASQYLTRTPFDTQLGYNRYPVPDRMADGGRVEGNELGGGATAAMLLAALKARHVNAIARPFSRALSKPVLGMESVSHTPLTGAQSDARYNIAREASMHEFGDRPVHRLQGAWQGDRGMEFNPLYSQELPRTMGRMIDAPEHMRYAGQMGENLEQTATPVSRFVPHLLNTSEGANALQVHGIDDKDLRSLAELLGPEVVTAHRPGKKAMVFPLGDRPMRDIATEINARFGWPKIRYGRSDPAVDRVLLSRKPLGYEDMTYEQAGAVPRSGAYAALEDAALKRPESWALSRGAK